MKPKNGRPYYSLGDAKRAIDALIEELGEDCQAIGEIRARYHFKNNICRGYSESSTFRWPAKWKAHSEEERADD